MSQMRVWANPEKTIGVGCARTLITPIGNDSPLASRVTEPGGTTAWDELCPQAHTPYLVTIEAAGFAPFSERFENIFQDLDIVLTPGSGPGPTPGGVRRLRLDHTDLLDPDGHRVYLRGADAFCALEIFLRFGPHPLRPVFAELRDRYRVNALRVWSMSVNLQQNEFGRPPFDPRTFPDYYPRTVDFFAFAAEYGFWQYFGLFPDVQLISSDVGWQQAHWDQLWDGIKDLDSLFGIEFQNEAAAHGFNALSNGFQTRNPNRPWVGTSYSTADPAYSSGSFPVQDLGGGPMGDLHPTRTYNACILDSCPVNNIYFKTGRALIIGEGDRFGWRGNPNRRQAELCANATRAGAIASFYHSMRGERCEVFDADTASTADGWFGAFGPI